MISEKCFDIRVWTRVLAELMLPVKTENTNKIIKIDKINVKELC